MEPLAVEPPGSQLKIMNQRPVGRRDRSRRLSRVDRSPWTSWERGDRDVGSIVVPLHKVQPSPDFCILLLHTPPYSPLILQQIDCQHANIDYCLVSGTCKADQA